MMENYRKGKNVEEELTKERIPMDNLPDNFLWMHVKGGTKVMNVVEFAEKAFKSDEHRHVVWSGSGGGVPKTISCAEIMKRNFKLFQVTRIAYQKIEEFWDPLQSGLDPIVVTRKVPAVHIFLSKDEIDPKTPGFQKGKTSTFWRDSTSNEHPKDEDYVYKNKKNSNQSNNNNNRAPRNSNFKRTRPNSYKKPTSTATTNQPGSSKNS